VWPIEPHTHAKHLILERYLHAWLPIITSNRSRVVFIDGFAGPGSYEGGEVGSPVIAMQALINHAHRQSIKSNVHFIFLESDRRRAAKLKLTIAPLAPQLPIGSTASVHHGTYADLLTQALDEIESNGKQLAPSLVFIDPFGVSGLPMSLVRRILRTRSCEVLINVMTGFMHRFIAAPEFEPHLDAIYGMPQWRQARELSGQARVNFLRKLYVHELSRADSNGKAKYVRLFSMLNRAQQPIYDLVFATNHPRGIDRMKDAMWKVDSNGGEQFSDATEPGQATLLDPAALHDSALISMLRDAYAGQTVTWAEVEERIRNSPFRILKTPISRAAKEPASGISIQSTTRGLDSQARITFFRKP
jgi:three-Cys-motif partner protein